VLNERTERQRGEERQAAHDRLAVQRTGLAQKLLTALADARAKPLTTATARGRKMATVTAQQMAF
jgi:hypothetical protein